MNSCRKHYTQENCVLFMGNQNILDPNLFDYKSFAEQAPRNTFLGKITRYFTDIKLQIRQRGRSILDLTFPLARVAIGVEFTF